MMLQRITLTTLFVLTATLSFVTVKRIPVLHSTTAAIVSPSEKDGTNLMRLMPVTHLQSTILASLN